MKLPQSFMPLLCFLSVLFLTPGSLANDASSEQADDHNWSVIKESLFAGRAIIQGDGVISLYTPKRAADSAVVPIKIQANIGQDGELYIKRLYLVVDNNPSPVVGTFTMSRLNGLASLSTRIRVNAYSHVRAIAETSDDELHMAANYVKASGGCSAPAANSAGHGIEMHGKMELQLERNENMVDVQFVINHPNNSGLQINQLTRNWIPSDYVTEATFLFNDENILSFTAGISMSENPSLGFHFKPKENGEIVAEVFDSWGRKYRHHWAVTDK